SHRDLCRIGRRIGERGDADCGGRDHDREEDKRNDDAHALVVPQLADQLTAFQTKSTVVDAFLYWLSCAGVPFGKVAFSTYVCDSPASHLPSWIVWQSKSLPSKSAVSFPCSRNVKSRFFDSGGFAGLSTRFCASTEKLPAELPTFVIVTVPCTESPGTRPVAFRIAPSCELLICRSPVATTFPALAEDDVNVAVVKNAAAIA